MPTYEYRCLSCDHQFERFQRMSDDPVAECEKCGEPVKRLLFPVAIHFKGSGFYSTDYGKRNTMGSVGGAAGAGNGGPAAEGSPGESAGSGGEATTASSSAGSGTGTDTTKAVATAGNAAGAAASD